MEKSGNRGYTEVGCCVEVLDVFTKPDEFVGTKHIMMCRLGPLDRL